MQVWTYPEKRMEELGATRWDVEWYTLRPDAPEEDWDPIDDTVVHHTAHATRAAAVKAAKRAAPKSLFGCAMVQKQVVDWYVERDGIAEWADVGDNEEVLP